MSILKPKFNLFGMVKRFGVLILVSAFFSAIKIVYLLMEMIPPAEIEFLSQFVYPIAFATWVQIDARKNRWTPCFDFGTFIYFTCLFSVPVYLVWKYGWNGLLLAGMFLLLIMVPGVVSLTTWWWLYS